MIDELTAAEPEFSAGRRARTPHCVRFTASLAPAALVSVLGDLWCFFSAQRSPSTLTKAAGARLVYSSTL